MPDVDRAAHAVSQEAIDAGVWVCGSGLEAQRASVVAADGTVTEGPQVSVGGLTVIDVPSREEAHQWAAKWAAACRCDQEIWELGFDPRSTRCSVRQTTESRVPTTPDHAPEQRCPGGRIDRSSAPVNRWL